jgi:Peptidase family M48
MKSPSPSLILAATLALVQPTDVDGKSVWWRGFSFRSTPKSVPTVPASVPSKPQNTGYPHVITTTTAWVKRAIDIVAPKDDFMRYYLAMRAGIAWVQYVALDQNHLDVIASAQYKALLNRANTLPDTHPTTIRVKSIAYKLTQAVRFDPRISPEVLWRMKWEIHVIQSDIINAFCMPGGKIAIYTGIIEKLKLTDDEIAIIIWHEISHALQDHSLKRIQSELKTNIGISAIGAMTGRHMFAFDIANRLWQLSHSRDHESQADMQWLELARMAWYDPCASATVWRKMSDTSRSQLPEFLSTHPSSQWRQETLTVEANKRGGKCS